MANAICVRTAKSRVCKVELRSAMDITKAGFLQFSSIQISILICRVHSCIPP